jgi:peptidoglycan-N-acetylglucosamine deacetylase
LHPPSETVAISHWPKVPNFVFARVDALAGPSLSDFAGTGGELVPQAEPFDRSSHRERGIPLPQAGLWPRESLMPVSSAATIHLPVPAQSLFEIQEMPHPTAEAVALLVPPSERTMSFGREAQAQARAQAVSADVGDSRRAARAKPISSHGKRSAASHQPRRGTSVAARARRAPLKHLVQVKKRNV